MLREDEGEREGLSITLVNIRCFSSNRSIKRKKFDDELVEYSLGLPGVSNIKVRLFFLNQLQL